MRPPGFEPGSSTWQADVLNHSSGKNLRIFYFSQDKPWLDYGRTNKNNHPSELKSISSEIENRIAYTVIKMQNDAKSDKTIKTTEWALKHLAHNINLLSRAR